MSTEPSWSYTTPESSIRELRALDTRLQEEVRAAPKPRTQEIGAMRWGLSKSIGRNMDVNLYRRFGEHHHIMTEFREEKPHGICSCGFAYQARVNFEITQEEFIALPGHGEFSDGDK